MINHSTKSPARRHKDESPGAKRRLCSPPVIYSSSEPSRSARLSHKTVRRKLTKEHETKKVRHTCEKLKHGEDDDVLSLSPASFSRNNGRPAGDALHKSHRLPVCLPAGVGERSETAVSAPASCSPPLSVSLRLISPFQLLLLILLPHCPREEFRGKLYLRAPPLEIYLLAVTLCALDNSVPPCFFLAELRGNC